MKSILLIFAFCIPFAVQVVAAPAIWDGTADVSWYEGDAQAYNLTTAEQLAGLAQLVNEGTSSFEGKTITLGADIFLNDTTGAAGGTWASVPRTAWTPIGTSSNPFRGEFDGLAGANKKRKIYGLYINDAEMNSAGLFGYTNGVKISNLDLLVGRIIAKNDVGALVGRSVAGTVTNVHAEVKVKGVNHVGGLVGYTTGSLIRVSVTENIVGQDSVGGVAGIVGGNVTGTVKSNCYFEGSVSGRSRVGGLAGEVGGSILNSYSIGFVNAVGDYVGGVAGVAGGSIDSTYHINGDVTGAQYVGGIVGKGGFVNNSYAECYVKGTGDYTGGLAGYLVHDVNNSYHLGNVDGKGYVGGVAGWAILVRDNYAEGNVTGTANYVGGLIGVQDNGGYRIVRSHAKGSVISTGSYVGGLVGQAYGRVDSLSYHIDGSVTGVDYVGGVAGKAQGDIKLAYHEGGDISGRNFVGGLAGASYGTCGRACTIYTADSSYSIANVSGTNFVGGLIGLDSAHYDAYDNRSTFIKTISNSYSHGDVSGVAFVGGIAGKVTKGVDHSNYNYTDFRALIQSSTHKGTVSGTDGYVGGVVGYSVGSVEKSSHSKGDVSGKGDYVGGLAGNVGGFVKNSYSEGTVSTIKSYVGGVSGFVGGSVDSAYHINGDVSGARYVGGVAGELRGAIKNSYAKGSVTGTSTQVGGVVGLVAGCADSIYHVGGTVSGTGYVGGIIGWAYGGNCRIADSYSEGDVTGSKEFVGGLVGEAYTTYRIVRSYARGTVTSTSSYVGGVVGQAYYAIDSTVYHIDGDVKGVDYVGGVVGYARDMIDSAYHKGGDVSGNRYVGGLVGYAASTINHSYATGAVTGQSFRIGGLAGLANNDVANSFHTEGDVSGVTYDIGGLIGRSEKSVSNSYALGSVYGEGSAVGGLVGYAYSGVISDCYHADGAVTSTSFGAGGVVGYTVGSISGSYHKNGSISGIDSVGGLVGKISGYIRNSYSEGVVSGRNTVGGLAGYSAGAIDDAHSLVESVTGIFQVGGLVGEARGVIDSSYAASNVKGDDNVGGLIGSARNSVSNSYALGNVVGDVDHSSAGNDNLGGLVGYVYAGAITKSMALGKVSGTTKLGGLVGRFEGSSISQSYAGGSVTGSYYGDPADEVGNYYIGGLVGLGKGSISESYASASVKGMEKDPFMTGCLIGSVSATMKIEKSYYDESICKLGVEGSDPESEETFAEVSGAPAQTTAAMQTVETFENWDFDGTWKILADSYPYLQIYSNSLTNAVVKTEVLDGLVYDGTEKTPIVMSVTLFGETLTWETEYSIAYENNVNAGTASIKICGLGSYMGCKIVPFEITGVAIKPTIEDFEPAVYTGDEIKPSFKVYNGETLLTASDYTVEYKNNINAGEATAIVTMKGNYSGTVSGVFEIAKAVPAVVTAPRVSKIPLGAKLSSSIFSGGVANVDGEFVWKDSSIVPTLKNEGYAAIFVPADTNNYRNSEEFILDVEVIELAHVIVKSGDDIIDEIFLEKGESYTLPSAEKTGYDFVGWYDGSEKVGVAGDRIVVTQGVELVAKFIVQQFVVTFIDFDETELQSSAVDFYAIPEYAGKTPSRAVTAQYTYQFVGWTPEVVAVSGESTYKAVYDSTVNEYVVTFLDAEGKELQSSKVAYGSMPKYEKNNPIKSSTVGYTYKFVGWTPNLSEVIGDVSYAATFDSTIRKYEISFVNSNGRVLQLSRVNYGVVPEYISAIPNRASTVQYAYQFVGWKPEVVAVAGKAAYEAVYDSVAVEYAVSFVDFNGDTLQFNELPYDAAPKYIGKTPSRPATTWSTYHFAGWTPEIANVSGAVTYKAVYDSTMNEYVVTFLGAEGEKLQSGNVAYGSMPQYEGNTPVKAATVGYTYKFVDWTPKLSEVVGDASYVATFDSTANKYAVSFVDSDGRVLQSGSVNYGVLPEYVGKTPNRASTAQYAYQFVGWTPEVVAVAGKATYKAVYDSVAVKYLISFVNFNGELLQSQELLYDATPKYTGTTPSRPATARCTYHFVGWTPEIANVSGAVTYKAVYDSTVNEYIVTFQGAKGEELQSDKVAYGSMPKYEGRTPVKAATVGYTYKFVGWTPKLSEVVKNVSYVATFDSTANKYAVSFIDSDGRGLQSGSVDYGVVPEYVGETPNRASTAQYTYQFVGWTPEVVAVAGEATYKAVYDSVAVKYVVSFVNFNGKLLQSQELLYGATPKYTGRIPTRNSVQYAYTFVGWDKNFVAVTGDATYKALFDSTVNKYVVSFVDCNGNKLLQDTLEYGVTPKYNGAELSHKTEKFNYEFVGWTPEITKVSGESTYKAVYDSTLREYAVTFQGADGKELQSSNVAYGKLPVYKGEIPVKKSTQEYDFNFSGWSPRIISVANDIVYEAVFDSIKIENVAIRDVAPISHFDVVSVNRSVQISGAHIGSVYALLDIQGHVMLKGRVETANFNLKVPKSGSYFIRIGNRTQRVNVK